jgi:hypothetical protein
VLTRATMRVTGCRASHGGAGVGEYWTSLA